jgi:transcription initiation factor TFIIIB Brf1 subunit/transcription initiation factor TFIIB
MTDEQLKCEACGDNAMGIDAKAKKFVCTGCGLALLALGENVVWLYHSRDEEVGRLREALKELIDEHSKVILAFRSDDNRREYVRDSCAKARAALSEVEGNV